jgi:hypothetical protein
MCSAIRIKNQKYFKPFDNTDNPCCWQVGAICEDVERVLDSQGIPFEVLSEDWGTSYSWIDANGVEHSLEVTCTDVESVTFTIEYFATRRAWMLFRRIVDNSETDFVKLVPELRALNDDNPADARTDSAT